MAQLWVGSERRLASLAPGPWPLASLASLCTPRLPLRLPLRLRLLPRAGDGIAHGPPVGAWPLAPVGAWPLPPLLFDGRLEPRELTQPGPWTPTGPRPTEAMSIELRRCGGWALELWLDAWLLVEYVE